LISLSAQWYILSQTNTDNQEAKAFEKWVRVAHFCFVEMGESDRHQQLVATIEAALAGQFPEVEVVDLDVHGGRGARLTVYVDRPGGVDIALCEAVTHALDDLRSQYALDVSSPGLDRPLRTAAQFDRATGERVYIRTDTGLEGRSVFRGRLTGSNADVVTLTLDEGPAVEIPFHTIAKAHVIFEFDDNGGHQ
jgi:ribosome maturation factor RimP